MTQTLDTHWQLIGHSTLTQGTLTVSAYPLTAKEINQHCRKVIMDNHNWIQSWASREWPQPHIHGDLLQVLDPEQMPREGTFRERVAAMSKVPLVEKLYCYAHGQHCHALDPSDVEFSGLPCEENSRCNTKRRYMEGRFGDLYGAWARRHGYLKTRLIILENTEDPCWNIDFSLYFVVYTTPWLP